MKIYFIITAIVLIVLSSCDRTYIVSGKVINDVDGQMITNAKIITSERLTIYSDSLGKFRLNLFGPGSQSDKLEVLVIKEGYETKYFDLSKYEDVHNITLELKPYNTPFITKYPLSFVTTAYYVNLTIINLIVFFTLCFILLKKVKYRWLWIALILLVNLTLRVNYINGYIDVDFFHFPFYFKHYSFFPFTFKIPILFSTIAFWSIYFIDRNRIIKN